MRDKDPLDFSNQKKKYSENNKSREKKLIDSDDFISNNTSNPMSQNSQNHNKVNEIVINNHNFIQINSNNNRTYRIRNKKKDYKEKDEMKINFIKNTNTLSNPENIMKFNKFNLKKYYQNKNRSINKLVKINENSESESDFIKKIQMKNNNVLKSNYNSDCVLERIDSNYLTGDLFENNNSSNLEKENLKNNLKNLENKESIGAANMFLNKEENVFRDNLFSKNIKETISYDSENRNIIRLKNLNTNDTTSLKSSEGSISKTNSFQLDYNSVIIFLF
jgi:hypothetical protein